LARSSPTCAAPASSASSTCARSSSEFVCFVDSWPPPDAPFARRTDATARFSLRSRALLTPCFPVTDEPGLTIELLVLTQGSIVGQVREKYLAREKFLRSGVFLDSDDFAPENVNLKKFDANTGRFIESKQDVATLTLSECEQFSYFA
jgi:hypothetical protein